MERLSLKALENLFSSIKRLKKFIWAGDIDYYTNAEGLNTQSYYVTLWEMEYKTIKISEVNYKLLLAIAAELQKERGKKISFDDALDDMIKEKVEDKKDIMELAGSWKMSDEEAKDLISGLYKERKVKSRRL